MQRWILTEISTFEKFPRNSGGVKNRKFFDKKLDDVRIHIWKFWKNFHEPNKDSTGENVVLGENLTFWKFPKNSFFDKNWKFLRKALEHVKIHIWQRFGGNPASNKDSTDAKVDFDRNFDIWKISQKFRGGQKSKKISKKVRSCQDTHLEILKKNHEPNKDSTGLNVVFLENLTFLKFPKNSFFDKNWKFLREALEHVKIHIWQRFGGNPASNKDSTDAKVDFDRNFDIWKISQKFRGSKIENFFENN